MRRLDPRAFTARVPNPLESDVAASRYYHNDLGTLDLRELVVELRRADLAIAIATNEDDRDWHIARRAAVVAEIKRRGLVLT